MTREEKAQIIEELNQKFQEKSFFYITDASGLTVEQVNNFRRLCYEKGVEYKVVKNTLIQKALANLETDYAPFDEQVLKGFSGIMFADTGKVPAVLIKEFRKSVQDKPGLKGASIDGALFIGEENLEALAKIKSKEEVIGDIIGILQSPAKNVVSALQSGKTTLAGLVKTLSERQES
ncbi:50S ribosomal protein L10 [Cytophagaceae bacterium ABcell3]|nr:50S ribosomal protein L10 [Cytophagaceae bacterium ABcell3]